MLWECKMKTVLILTNSINGLYSFRRELIERLINEKNAVIISSPQGTKVLILSKLDVNL